MSEAGKFSYIIPNKWMRANYGKPLRTWLKTKRLLRIIDYGDLPVFEEATTYPCILSVEKGEPNSALQVVKMDELAFDRLQDYVEANSYEQPQAELDDGGWSLANQDVQKVLDKLNKVGVPLEQYVDGKIYYGIKTGLNEAFIIDETTKNELISEDPKSAEVIKPFLAGRDVKRYYPPQSDNHLILFPNGWTDANAKAAKDKWLWLQKEYPAIARHLEPLSTRAKKRSDQGEYWWELRPCAYYAEFEKPKIIYAEIAMRGQFYLDECNFYGDTTSFILGSSSPYILGILNSKLFSFGFSQISSGIRGGFYRWKRQYMFPMPIRTIDFSNPADQAAHDRMTQMVETMLDLHKQKADTSGDTLAALETRITDLDAAIDALVYELYDLTEEEIKIVEGSVS